MQGKEWCGQVGPRQTCPEVQNSQAPASSSSGMEKALQGVGPPVDPQATGSAVYSRKRQEKRPGHQDRKGQASEDPDTGIPHPGNPKLALRPLTLSAASSLSPLLAFTKAGFWCWPSEDGGSGGWGECLFEVAEVLRSHCVQIPRQGTQGYTQALGHLTIRLEKRVDRDSLTGTLRSG